MAQKKFNLETYNSDTTRTQYKHKKYTTYIENEVEESTNSDSIRDTSSKRINMAFSDENYEYIISQSNKMLIPIAAFLNSIIPKIDDEEVGCYLQKLSVTRSKDNISRRKGNKVKRINLKFQNDVYNKIVLGADKFNMTLTQYVNTIVEIFKYKCTINS